MSWTSEQTVLQKSGRVSQPMKRIMGMQNSKRLVQIDVSLFIVSRQISKEILSKSISIYFSSVIDNAFH